MKFIITEEQFDSMKEKVIKLPYNAFDYNWKLLQEYLKRKNQPLYILIGDVDLRGQDIKSLENLIAVYGKLILESEPIEDLGRLVEVRGFLDLFKTQITNLGMLKKVDGDLDLRKSKLSMIAARKRVERELYMEIINDIEINGDLYI
jgi:hypothetical protein